MRESVVYHRPLPRGCGPFEWRSRYEHAWMHHGSAELIDAALSAGLLLDPGDAVDICARCGIFRMTYRGRVLYFAADRRPMKTSEPACIRHGRW